MSGPISRYFIAQHEAVRALLDRCLVGEASVDAVRFDEFRHRLLKLISVEERVLFPALVRRLGHPPVFRNALRKDHAGIAALCVPVPEREWVENLRDLLDHHARVEAAPGGFYEACDQALTDEMESLLAAMEALPPLTLAPFNAGPRVRELIARVLSATGITEPPA